jgi:hypothetical protein
VHLCLEQDGTIRGPQLGLDTEREEQLLLPAKKHELFHEDCQHCHDGREPTLDRLCEPCRHRCIPHILTCHAEYYIRDFVYLTLAINPFLEASAGCDFCQSVDSYVEKDSHWDIPSLKQY